MLFRDKDLQQTYGTKTYHDDILEDTLNYEMQYTNDPSEYSEDYLNAVDENNHIYPEDLSSLADTKQPEKKQTNIPGYKVHHKFKFFRMQSRAAGKSSWKWPYVDIKYYTNNGTHITNIDFESEIFHVPVPLFYPLVMRPFGTVWLPAPKNTRAYLRAKYKRFTCSSSHWNHKLERKKHAKRVNCNNLVKFYPFVWRYRFDGGVLETLKLGHHIVHTLALNDQFQGRYGPFTL